MYALLFDDQLQLVDNYPAPTLLPGEAIIKPHLVGICNTDIEITRGYKGFRGVLGHEFVGTVVACTDHSWIGQRVVGEINAACGNCPTCHLGVPSHCPNRTTLGIFKRDGAMAERFSLPIACLHRVPDTLSDEKAVFVEPLAAALEILELSHVRPTDRVAVVGDGKLGLLCAQVLRLPGCSVTVIGRHPERCAFLRDQGIEILHVNDVQPDRFVAYNLVVECTGQASGLAIARQITQPRGRLVLKSTFSGQTTLDLSSYAVDEIQLLGSRCGPFAPALRLLDAGLIATDPMLEGRFPLREGLEAFAATAGRLKIVLEV
jgi:alcohol dehydrogenase